MSNFILNTTKKILGILPKPILYQFLKLQKMKVVDLLRLNLIREKDLDYLVNPENLEKDLLPKLGFNNERLYQFPPELYSFCGQGLFCWQYPNQFSKFLVHISRYKIESYLEIGVRHGGTFIIINEYLKKIQPLKKSVGIDICYSPSLIKYQKINPKINFLQINSTSEKFRKYLEAAGDFDLVLIDGDHDEAPCRQDFETVKNYAKIIVFHDIVSNVCPGVVKVWQEVKNKYADQYDFFEFTDQYESVFIRTGEKFLGIGVAVKKE